ncbi:MAG: arginine--tRNA ligase [Actinomycetota bacterium]
MISRRILSLATAALRQANEAGDLSCPEDPAIEVTRPRLREHGDWSTNVALAVAKQAGMSPRRVAEILVRRLPEASEIAKVEIAGPGFLNFHLAHRFFEDLVRRIVAEGERFGACDLGGGERVQVEFVSANPTGPMHVGHGRWAAVGDALANLMAFAGWQVEREFYVNDAGSQMDAFGRSVQAAIRHEPIPEDGYKGAYVVDLAEEMRAEAGEAAAEWPVEEIREQAYARMMAHIRGVLEDFGVHFEVYFSERTLHTAGSIMKVVNDLVAAGRAYEQDGAIWLRSTEYGDDKDRVLVREGGDPTYFAGDAAYFLNKRARGFDRLIYLWGADHHGYVKRNQALVAALGEDPNRCEYLIGQLVQLLRGGEPVRMSKRTGEMVTFAELLAEVGRDAARYTFLRYSLDSPIDFDIEEVTRASLENPVYYVQYAHARICSVLRHAAERGVALLPIDQADLGLLVDPAEIELMRKLAEFEELIELAARLRAPYRLTRLAEEIGAAFHRFYADCRVVTDDAALTQSRLWLATAARGILANILGLLGVGAPERM